MTIKVGIIGASFAKAAYLPAFKHIEEVEVVSLSSFIQRLLVTISYSISSGCLSKE